MEREKQSRFFTKNVNVSLALNAMQGWLNDNRQTVNERYEMLAAAAANPKIMTGEQPTDKVSSKELPYR